MLTEHQALSFYLAFNLGYDFFRAKCFGIAKKKALFLKVKKLKVNITKCSITYGNVSVSSYFPI